MNEDKRIEEIGKLYEHIHNLEQSRDYWKAKAEKLTKKLHAVQKERRENGKQEN